MKKYLLLIIILICLSGCTIKVVDPKEYSYDTEMSKILSYKIKNFNNIGKGYKYYAPIGMKKINEESNNDILVKNNIRYYLFVDVVGYYYKTDLYIEDENDAFYFRLINKNGKKGYLKILKSDNKLFVEMNYNYAKIEVYTDKDHLNEVVMNSSYVLSSMKFNDSLLNKLYEQGDLNSKEETYHLFENNGDDGNFLKYVEEYDKYKDDGTEEKELILEEKTTTKENKATETTTKEDSNN